MLHPLDHIDAVAFQRIDFIRIVGHQTDAADPQEFEHSGCRQINTLVGVKAELLIRVDCVETAILQFVCAQFVDQADASTFLREIKQDTGSGCFNFFQGTV